MSNLPETIGVPTFNPKININVLNIVKEYLECMPYILTLNDTIYILPNNKIVKHCLYNIACLFNYINIDIFRDATYKYNPILHTYDISYHIR